MPVSENLIADFPVPGALCLATQVLLYTLVPYGDFWTKNDSNLAGAFLVGDKFIFLNCVDQKHYKDKTVEDMLSLKCVNRLGQLVYLTTTRKIFNASFVVIEQ